MHYKFPEIRHLDEVRSAIAGAAEFIIAEREWGYVVNYLVMTPSAFPPVTDLNSAIRRECRGLLFDLEGNLISRPLHKFFNVNQVDETQAHKIDLDQPHVILEKLDGSFIRPLPAAGAYRLSTKMGITDVSRQAEGWLKNRPNYDKFIRSCIASDITPIFEWCSRQQKIVVDYPEDRLVLIAARNNIFGNYVGIHGLRGLAEAFELDLVREYKGTTESMEALLAETRDMEGGEGWIIRWDNGHMVKMKGHWYLTRHRAKDSIGREKDTIAMLLADELDDVKPVISPEDRGSLEKFEAAFWQGVAQTAVAWQAVNNSVRAQHGADRKAFAVADGTSVMDGNMKSAIFRAWDAPDFDWRQAVLDTVAKNIGTQTRVDAVRGLWGGTRWTYGSSAGDE
jgi:RNA ligase